MPIPVLGALDTVEMSDQGEPSVSIVIPAYNEAHRIGASIRALRECTGCVSRSSEIILVIERSTDGTLDLAREMTGQDPSFTIIAHDSHRGKGHAVRSGMLRARGEIAFFMDVDLSTPLSEMDRFLSRFQESPPVDILVGNRRHPGCGSARHRDLGRRTMSRVFNVLARLVTGIRISDTQCGFKAFRRHAREAVFSLQELDGFAFDVELLLLAERLGLRVADLPVRCSPAAGSRINVVRDSMRMLTDVIRVRRIVRNKMDRKAPVPSA